MSKKLCIAAKTCLLLLTTKTVTAIWPLAIHYQRYITVSEIWVYSYMYNLAVIGSWASCASGGPSWSCVNCRCNCASVCVLDTFMLQFAFWTQRYLSMRSGRNSSFFFHMMQLCISLRSRRKDNSVCDLDAKLIQYAF